MESFKIAQKGDEEVNIDACLPPVTLWVKIPEGDEELGLVHKEVLWERAPNDDDEAFLANPCSVNDQALASTGAGVSLAIGGKASPEVKASIIALTALGA